MTRVAVLALALLAVACTQDVSALRDHQVAGAAVTVHIVDSPETVGEYTPAVVHVTAGDTVAFVNASGDYHTVSFFSGPAGATSSAGIAPGATFEMTPPAPGVYRYRCRFHHGMVGEIIVAQP
jgi:plastocyanin